MKNTAWLIGAVAGLAILAYLGRYQLKSIATSNQEALANPNVRAFLNTIGHFESNGQYDVIYGDGTFTDYSTHPNIRVPFFNPSTKKMDYSTAAGKYQINHPTWLMLSALPGAPTDFTPASQDWFAVALLKLNGALSPIINGDIPTALQLASKTWASLPYTDSGQHHTTLAVAEQVYAQNGGALA